MLIVAMSKIKNFDDLALTSLRKAALLIAEAGLEAIDTGKAIKKNVRLENEKLIIKDNEFSLANVKRIFFIGVGKCAAEAAKAIEGILGEKLQSGVLIDVVPPPDLKKIRAFQGTHPLPTEANIAAAKEIVLLLKNLNENDFVIFIVSGGGSTFLCLPEDRACDEEAKIIRALMDAGADISEINTVRKHLSLARGGYLAKYAYPARGVALIFSDVPGNDIQFIASGPTVKDETTIHDAEKILERYDIPRVCGIPDCGLVETPKEEKFFAGIKNMIIVSNKIALGAMANKAEELGFKAKIQTDSLTGRAREVAKNIMEDLHKMPEKTALFYGGETTLVVRNSLSKGGRNMHFALSALQYLKDDELIIGLASDGRDNGDFAGAICDKMTKEKAFAKKLDILEYLDANNEYPFFEKAGDYILTGITGSNVSDLIIAIHD